jgi:sigma-B regulation protein RsbQ
VDYSPTHEENLKKLMGNNYELNILNGTCHFPMIENPKEFNELLEKIILKLSNKK